MKLASRPATPECDFTEHVQRSERSWKSPAAPVRRTDVLTAPVRAAGRPLLNAFCRLLFGTFFAPSGVTHRQIVRLLLVESLLLAVAGAVLGVMLATWGASLLLAYFASPETPLAITADPDRRILLFTSALAMLTALLAGIVPALRSSGVDAAPAL